MEQISAVTRAEQSIREALERKEQVIILGWRSAFHSPVTRAMPEEQIRFIEADTPPKFLPQNIGALVSTRLLGHCQVDALKRAGLERPLILDVGPIKQILHRCAKSYSKVVSTPESKVTPQVSVPNAPVVIPASIEVKNDTPPHPEGEPAMTSERPLGEGRRFFKVSLGKREEIRFAQAFMTQCDGDVDCSISSYRIRELATSCFKTPPSTQVLLNHGLLEPCGKEGSKRVSYYKPGPRLIELYTNPTPVEEEPEEVTVSETRMPSGSIQQLPSHYLKMVELIASKANLVNELESVEARAEEIRTLLQSIEEAEKLNAQIERLFSR
jgi:hypothetical protein